MVPVLVLTHGELATALLTAARSIDPHLDEGSQALALPWDVDSARATELVKEAIDQQRTGDGLVVLTDMFGGTATNVTLPFMKPDEVEVVTGVNLPMLVKLGSLRRQEIGPKEMADRLRDAGQKSIRVASNFLRRPGEGES
jgi:PTS system mannose-specific IIA component